MRNLLIIILIGAFFSCSKEGKKVPDFSLRTLSGDVISSSDLKGKIVVMQVWATWCGTCIVEIPQLNALVKKYENDDDVIFLAFSDEPDGIVRASLARFPFHFIHIANAESYTDKLQSRMVKTYPQTLILDRDLIVKFDHSDGTEEIGEKLDLIIQELK